MKASKKNRRRLTKRISAWNEMRAEGMHDSNNKIVRRGDGKPITAYRRPGSQSGRK